MQQKSLRMPLVVTGIGLQEQAEHNVSETESTTNFTEKHGEQFISLFCILAYRKVASSRLSRLIAHPRIFRRLMKGKFDAYVL